MAPNTLSPLRLYVARPTLRIEGREHEEVGAALRSMRMREDEGGMSSMELEFVNWASRADASAGPAFEDEGVLGFGTRITVYAGQADSPTEIFAGRVSAIEYAYDADGPPRLVVHAEDALAAARAERRSELHHKRSVADIARDVAGRCGLRPDIHGLEEREGDEVQLNETDLGFLRRLLARRDADLQVVGDALVVGLRADLSRGSVELDLAGQLLRLRAVADLSAQVTDVRVTGFDPASGEAVSGNGASEGFAADRSGADIRRRAFGERVEQVGHRVALTQAEARGLARAEFARRARNFVTVDAEAMGNPAIRVGAEVEFTGVPSRWRVRYRVEEVVHRYDQQDGYRTEFTAGSPVLGAVS